MSKKVKVGGTDIGSITVTGGYVRLQKWTGMHGTAIALDVPDLVAGTWPALNSVKVPRKVWAGFMLYAASEAALESLIDAVTAVVQTTGTITLTRERTLLSGTQTSTASAVYAGGMDQLEYASHNSARVTLEWQLLADWA